MSGGVQEGVPEGVLKKIEAITGGMFGKYLLLLKSPQKFPEQVREEFLEQYQQKFLV